MSFSPKRAFAANIPAFNKSSAPQKQKQHPLSFIQKPKNAERYEINDDNPCILDLLWRTNAARNLTTITLHQKGSPVQTTKAVLVHHTQSDYAERQRFIQKFTLKVNGKSLSGSYQEYSNLDAIVIFGPYHFRTNPTTNRTISVSIKNSQKISQLFPRVFAVNDNADILATVIKAIIRNGAAFNSFV